MELEVTWRRSFRFWWAIWWRYIVFSIVLVIAAFIVAILLPVYIPIFLKFSPSRLDIDPATSTFLMAIASYCYTILCKIYVQKQFILGKKIGDFVTILVDPEEYRAQQDNTATIHLLTSSPMMPTFAKSFRLWWAIFWKSFLLEMLLWALVSLLATVILFMIRGNLDQANHILFVSHKVISNFISPFFEIFVQRKYVFQKRISDFVPIMVDPVQYQAQQEKNLPPPPPPRPKFEHPLAGGL